MHAFPSWFRFERLQWTFPVAVTLHNLEEAIWLPSWSARHAAQLPWRIGAEQFRLTVAFLTFAAYVVTWLSIHRVRQRGWTYLFVAYTFAMFLNVWVPHLPASILFRGYTPGVVTAVFLNLPVTLVLLIAAIRERVVPSPAIAGLVFGLPAGFDIGFAALFASKMH